MSSESVVGIDAFQASLDTFVEIVSSGFLVSSFDGQVSQVTLGSSQPLVFKPSLYSIDLDTGSIVSSNETFKFYCTVVDNGVSKDYPMLYQDVYIDLAMFQQSSNIYQMSSNTTCFANSCKFLLFLLNLK